MQRARSSRLTTKLSHLQIVAETLPVERLNEVFIAR